MTAFDWRPVGDPDPKRFAEARAQLLSAAQWLARVERSFVEPVSGGDVSLRWSDERGVIATHRFASDIALELQIDGLAMQFTNDDQPSDHEIDVDERSPAHIEAWILIELLHRGVERDKFSKDLPYDTSAMMNGDAIEFSPAEYQAELRELRAWFDNAVSAIRSALSSQERNVASLTISPRDLRVEAIADGCALGFLPGEAEMTEPFFYVSDAGASEVSSTTPRATLKASEIPSERAAQAVQEFFAENAAPTKH